VLHSSTETVREAIAAGILCRTRRGLAACSGWGEGGLPGLEAARAVWPSGGGRQSPVAGRSMRRGGRSLSGGGIPAPGANGQTTGARSFPVVTRPILAGVAPEHFPAKARTGRIGNAELVRMEPVAPDRAAVAIAKWCPLELVVPTRRATALAGAADFERFGGCPLRLGIGLTR